MSCCRLSIYIILCYVILYNVILYNVIAYNVMYVIYVYVMCVIYVCVMLCDTSAIFLNLTWGSARLQYVSSMASGHPIWRAESQVSFKRTQCYIVLRRGRSEEVACLPEVPDGQDVLLLFKTILSRMCFFWCIYLLYCIYIYISTYISLSIYIYLLVSFLLAVYPVDDADGGRLREEALDAQVVHLYYIMLRDEALNAIVVHLYYIICHLSFSILTTFFFHEADRTNAKYNQEKHRVVHLYHIILCYSRRPGVPVIGRSGAPV